MLKIRRPLGRLIFNMGIATPGKTVFLIETAPWFTTLVRSITIQVNGEMNWSEVLTSFFPCIWYATFNWYIVYERRTKKQQNKTKSKQTPHNFDVYLIAFVDITVWYKRKYAANKMTLSGLLMHLYVSQHIVSVIWYHTIWHHMIDVASHILILMYVQLLVQSNNT